MRNRFGNAAWIAIAIIGLATAAMQAHPKATAAQRLSMLRMQIVSTAKTVESANTQGIITPVEYTAAKAQVMKAVTEYNAVLDRFTRYNQLARKDEQSIAALLAAVVMEIKSKRGA